MAEIATFGAGCFWGVEAAFQRVPGVIDTAVGYSGGHTGNPTYQDVCTDETGHAEVVQVTFDPAKVSFEQLLDVLWQAHDPTQVTARARTSERNTARPSSFIRRSRKLSPRSRARRWKPAGSYDGPSPRRLPPLAHSTAQKNITRSICRSAAPPLAISEGSHEPAVSYLAPQC